MGSRLKRLAGAGAPGAALVTALTVALVAALPAAPARAAPISAHAMVYSCCTPSEMKERIFAEAAAMGAEYVRVDVQILDVFEQDAGGRAPAPDWRGLDEVMALSRRHGVRVLAILLYPPSWITTCPERFPDHVRCPVTGLAEYGRMAGEIAAHAGPVINHWEIVNEPDGEWAFEGSAEDYARMLAAAHDGIKARAPRDQVLLGGIMRPHRPEWLARVFATPGANAARKFDIGNVHLRGPVGAVVRRFGLFREELRRYGFGGPLWVTEHGYAADPAYQDDPAYAGGDASQAAYLTQTLVGLGEVGAGQTFVTLRDNLGGAYASEGVAHVTEGPGYPSARRPSFAAVQRLTGGWEQVMAWRGEQRRQERLSAEARQAIEVETAPAAIARQRRRYARAVLRQARAAVRRARAAAARQPGARSRSLTGAPRRGGGTAAAGRPPSRAARRGARTAAAKGSAARGARAGRRASQRRARALRRLAAARALDASTRSELRFRAVVLANLRDKAAAHAALAAGLARRVAG